MTLPFFFLLAAAGIFRLLSADSRKTFNRRLASLLPRNVMKDHLQVLMADFPERAAEFRRRVLPYSAFHVLLNTAACGCFAAALWIFPPAGMNRWDLLFVQYGSLLLMPLAFVADAVVFARTLMATFTSGAEADGAL